MGGRKRAWGGVVVLLLVVLQPGARAEAQGNASRFLDRDEVSLPDRSRVLDSVDVVDGCGAPPSAGRFDIDGQADDWTGQPTMIAGTGRHDSGEYTWTDYPYDDAGTGSFSYPGEGEDLVAEPGTAGKATPRQERYGSNAADLVELRAAADDEYLYLLARFNFINAIDATVLGLAFDLDRDDTTGFADWPRGARLRTPGTDLFLTAHGQCAFVTDADGDEALDDTGGAIRVGTKDNVFEIALPMGLLDGSDAFRLAGGSGIWDPAPAAWMTVDPIPRTRRNQRDRPVGALTPNDTAVFNLLFRDDETTSGSGGTVAEQSPSSPRAFQNGRQSEVLAGGTNGLYGVDLELATLQPGASSDPLLVRRANEKDFARVYRSRIDAEGVILVSNAVGVFLGRYEPYGIYLPSCYDDGTCPWPAERAPLAIAPHGGSGNHVGNSGRSIAEGGGDLYGLQTAFERLEEEIGAIVVRPLGRGQRNPWWRGYGEADLLEAMDDAERVYGTDPERRLVTGGSLGGYATFRTAALHPDLWTGAFAHCPAAYENSISERYAGNIEPSTQPFVIDPLVPALWNTPLRQASGTLDPLTPINSNRRLRDAALAAGLDYHYTEYLAGSHCFDVATGVRPWIEFHTKEVVDLLTRPRTSRPARVWYGIDARHFPAAPEPIGLYDIRDVGISYTGAWWVSGLEVRPEVEQTAVAGGAGPEVVAWIDARSRAIGGWDVATQGCGEGQGLDSSSGNPDLEPTGPTPHTYLCREHIASSTATEPVLDLAVRNLSAGTIDVAETGLGSPGFAINATGDGSFTLRLDGIAGNASGECVTDVTVDGGSTVVELTIDSEACVVEVTA